jgi:hypothetical protein
MFPPPNPVEAARATVQATVDALRAHATPPPKQGPYEAGWDGKHCAFIYTGEVVLAFPPVPTFEKQEKA